MNKGTFVQTNNEYGNLRSVLLGSAQNGAWPTKDENFNIAISKSTFMGKPQLGRWSDHVIREATEDLNRFADVMTNRGISVFRPIVKNNHWAYSARDIILTVGNKIIECPTPFISRSTELDLYPDLFDADCEIIRAPRPESANDPMFDAANVLKINDKLVYAISHSANEAGAKWLQEKVGTQFEVVPWKVIDYQITHIDSTLLSLGPHTILVNASRVKNHQLPYFMQDFKKIWIKDVVARQFQDFPFASKWIGINILCLDPNTVVIDEIQTDAISELKRNKFDVIALPMRQSRTLGGGFHCVTCDLVRD